MFALAKDVYHKWIRKTGPTFHNCSPPSLEDMVEQAKRQWQLAQAYFENVKDPELVDLAINNLEAAEKQYNYLLKQMREQ